MRNIYKIRNTIHWFERSAWKWVWSCSGHLKARMNAISSGSFLFHIIPVVLKINLCQLMSNLLSRRLLQLGLCTGCHSQAQTAYHRVRKPYNLECTSTWLLYNKKGSRLEFWYLDLQGFLLYQFAPVRPFFQVFEVLAFCKYLPTPKCISIVFAYHGNVLYVPTLFSTGKVPSLAGPTLLWDDS